MTRDATLRELLQRRIMGDVIEVKQPLELFQLVYDVTVRLPFVFHQADARSKLRLHPGLLGELVREGRQRPFAIPNTMDANLL